MHKPLTFVSTPVALFERENRRSDSISRCAKKQKAGGKKTHGRWGGLLLTMLLFVSSCAFGQVTPEKEKLADTSDLDYDEIFSELALLLDDLKGARSFGMVNLGVTTAYFNFAQASGSNNIQVRNKLLLSPSLAYYHKSGFGIAAEVNVVNDGQSLNPFQASVTGSYDYLKNRNFATGLLVSHYFDKDGLPFYTSPLHNDAWAYFTYRKRNFRPSVSIRYGWGSQDAVTSRQTTITKLHKKHNQTTTSTQIDTTSVSVADFNLTTSLRYNFSFPDVLTKGDYFRFTPQLSLISGTQQYGFNAVSSSTTNSRGNSGKTTTTETQELVLYNDMRLRPLLLTAFLKTEYVKGKFFIQPQIAFDYSFSAEKDKFTPTFSVNAGILLY